VSNNSKTKAELIQEITDLQHQLAELEAGENVSITSNSMGVNSSKQDQSQAELESDEKRFKTFSEASFEGIEISDKDMIIDCNTQLCSLLGYERSELLGKSILTGVAPQSRELVHSAICSGKDEPCEFVACRKDGTQFPAIVQGRNLSTEPRNLRVSAIRDITDQKRTEESLNDKRNLLQTLIDSIPDLIHYKDTEGRYILNNRAHLRSIGVQSQNDVFGKTAYDYYPPQIVQQFHKFEKQLIQTGEPILHQEESICHHPSGDPRWYLTNRVPIKDHEGRVTSYLVISTDITEGKRFQEELQEERNLLRILIDHLPDYIYVKDRKGRFVIANAAVAQQLGYDSEDELLGKTDFDLYPNALAIQLYNMEQDIIRSGEGIYDVENSVNDASKEKKERWVSTTKIPFKDAQGTIIGIIAIGRDLTERKHMEETLRETADKFRFVFEHAYDGLSIFEEAADRSQRRLIDCNERYAEMAGRSRDELLKLGITKNIATTLSEDRYDSLHHGVVFSGSYSWLRPDGKDNVIEYTAAPIEMENKIITIGIDRDVTERKRVEAERERLISDLQKALTDIKTLSGLVPICSNCKKIRDDKGYWTQVEAYIQKRSNAQFSHGVCPECMAKHYPYVDQNQQVGKGN
jgi:PAS domain S-box-containing protein